MPVGPVNHRPDAPLGWAVGAVVFTAVLARVVIAVLFGDRLPAEMPRHYGLEGQPTALWPLWTSVILLSARARRCWLPAVPGPRVCSSDCP